MTDPQEMVYFPKNPGMSYERDYPYIILYSLSKDGIGTLNLILGTCLDC